MKELAKASEIEKPISSDKKQNINVLNDLFVEEWETFHLAIIDLQDKSLLNSKYSNFYSHLESYSIFHPPINIS
jgi:ribonucleotide reductase alpha subunit